MRSVGLVSRKTSPPSEIAAQAMVEVGIVADRLKRRWPGWIWPPAA
ncbi:hypothetical protein N6G02_14370 [Cupriavidus gilardii]|nr:hypothetical protein [Cupriavidus gilardii]MCT9016559.1 hypothetical protein [Cupriavidus gilardii]MCT9053018.1 hypothetical protein [Cupriavidus gilardii]MCT9074077.1 hypothetical protein [Cupriavidus gilardii]MCT9117317.1 hypothetical protein [Cupriavidus gilardii]QKS61843.1 hypothetical protein FOB47_08440 [Cupriavidus gilardii]